MKKTLLLLLISISTLAISAQNGDYENYYKGIESNQDLHLSAEQITKLKKLKREIGPQFAAIGKDRSLSGYEKGQKKRALAQKHRADIQNILTSEQKVVFEKKYGNPYTSNSVRNQIGDSYDDRLDALEEKYDAKIDAVEDNESLSKEERKARKNALKAEYKREKERLKAEKESAKRSTIL